MSTASWSATRDATRGPTRARAASRSRPDRGSSDTSRGRSPSADRSRADQMKQTWSSSSRRAAKAKAAEDSWSTHCASSTTTRTGRRSASAASRVIVAAATRNLSGSATPLVQPSARPRASAWTSGSSATRSRNSASAWWRPAYAIGCSDSTPPTHRRRKSGARSSTARRSVDFPIPGSPVTSSDPPAPARTAVSNAPQRASSSSRPTRATARDSPHATGASSPRLWRGADFPGGPDGVIDHDRRGVGTG